MADYTHEREDGSRLHIEDNPLDADVHLASPDQLMRASVPQARRQAAAQAVAGDEWRVVGADRYKRVTEDRERLGQENDDLRKQLHEAEAQAAQPDRPEPVDPVEPDPELHALHRIVAAMSTLNGEQQARTVRHLSARYGDADDPIHQMRATLQEVTDA